LTLVTEVNHATRTKAPTAHDSPMSRPWDARRITAVIISALIVALAAVVYLLGL